MPGPHSILLSGATGLVGGRLVPALLDQGRSLRALTRHPERTGILDPRAVPVGWDGTTPPASAWTGVDAVIHLAGEPLFGGRLTRERRRRVRASRVESTRAIGRELAARPASDRPAVWISASAVGYYGSRGEARLDEDASSGDGFLAELCRDWEAATAPAADAGVRVICLRIGIVLAREGGALATMALPFRMGLGGRLGDGRQWVPWIHLDDLVALLGFALDDPGLRGPVNAVAPEPVRNQELTTLLARTLHRPALFTAPAFALRLALGELSDELLGSKRAVPTRALAAGFRFASTDLATVLESELG